MKAAALSSIWAGAGSAADESVCCPWSSPPSARQAVLSGTLVFCMLQDVNEDAWQLLEDGSTLVIKAEGLEGMAVGPGTNRRALFLGA